MNNKKRKLKPLKGRKPEIQASYSEIVKRTAKTIRFRESDVRNVIKKFLEITVGELESKRSVSLPGIGILFPAIKPSRVGVALYGGVGKPEKVIVPDRWLLKFQPSTPMRDRLYALEISQEELDKMYYK